MHIQTSNQEKLDLGFNKYTCNWGVHICGLYETEEERDEIVFGFLHAGDLAGDLQLYCPVERTKDHYAKSILSESRHLVERECSILFK